jgi:hypothetical protein
MNANTFQAFLVADDCRRQNEEVDHPKLTSESEKPVIQTFSMLNASAVEFTPFRINYEEGPPPLSPSFSLLPSHLMLSTIDFKTCRILSSPI